MLAQMYKTEKISFDVRFCSLIKTLHMLKQGVVFSGFWNLSDLPVITTLSTRGL